MIELIESGNRTYRPDDKKEKIYRSDAEWIVAAQYDIANGDIGKGVSSEAMAYAKRLLDFVETVEG